MLLPATPATPNQLAERWLMEEVIFSRKSPWPGLQGMRKHGSVFLAFNDAVVICLACQAYVCSRPGAVESL